MNFTTEGFPIMEADRVARIDYRGLMRGKRLVVTGWLNRLVVAISGVIPLRWMTWGAGRLNRPRP